jgi:hypothetical protein
MVVFDGSAVCTKPLSNETSVHVVARRQLFRGLLTKDVVVPESFLCFSWSLACITKPQTTRATEVGLYASRLSIANTSLGFTNGTNPSFFVSYTHNLTDKTKITAFLGLNDIFQLVFSPFRQRRLSE